MKTLIYSVSAVLFVCLVGVALAGAGPERRGSRGCHGDVVVVEQEAGCHGRAMRAPAVAAAGCHGGRITAAERRETRQAVRNNANVTREQFRAAARQGDVSSVEVSAPTFEMAPACNAEGCHK